MGERLTNAAPIENSFPELAQLCYWRQVSIICLIRGRIVWCTIVISIVPLNSFLLVISPILNQI